MVPRGSPHCSQTGCDGDIGGRIGDMGAQPEVVRGCLESPVSDPDAVLAAANHEDAKARLRNYTDQAIRLGTFGAPSFMVGSELFWGNDRMAQAMSRVQR